MVVLFLFVRWTAVSLRRGISVSEQIISKPFFREQGDVGEECEHALFDLMRESQRIPHVLFDLTVQQVHC